MQTLVNDTKSLGFIFKLDFCKINYKPSAPLTYLNNPSAALKVFFPKKDTVTTGFEFEKSIVNNGTQELIKKAKNNQSKAILVKQHLFLTRDF